MGKMRVLFAPPRWVQHYVQPDALKYTKTKRILLNANFLLSIRRVRQSQTTRALRAPTRCEKRITAMGSHAGLVRVVDASADALFRQVDRR